MEFSDDVADRYRGRPATPSLETGSKEIERDVKNVEYVTEPLYVFEMRNPYGHLVRSEESFRPHHRQTPYESDHPNMIEISRKIECKLGHYASEAEKTLIFTTCPTSAPVLRILSPYLFDAMHDVITYYPERNSYIPITMLDPYGLLVHHTTQLEAYKPKNTSDLSEKQVEERNLIAL